MRSIFISAGHSAQDPGAVGNGVTEAAVVLEFRDLVAHYLQLAGAMFDRDGAKGENLPLREAVKRIPRGGLAVEFHLNAAASPSATGVETLSAAGLKPFGAGLCAVIAARLGIRNRGAKGEDAGQHSRLAFVQAGGVIVELFFVSNPADLAAYQAVKWLLAKDVAHYLIQQAAEPLFSMEV